jgi:lycopene cyclase domain-containing protein
MKYLYLILDLATLLGPLVLSFDKKVAFYKTWKALFPAIGIMMLLFIPWDMYFTEIGVWGFNPDYLSGIYIGNLPLEECLFFIVVPYACVFIYACLKAYLPNLSMSTSFQNNIILALFFALVLFIFLDLSAKYTTLTFSLLAIYLLAQKYVFKSEWLNYFLLAYAISLIPFLIVNGILTGAWIDEQVVWYSSDHIIGKRIGTIPVEDTMYNMLMLLMTVHFYEFFIKKTGCFLQPEINSIS